MVRIISALFLAAFAATSFAQEKLQLTDNPPDRHIVVPGDTLWSISGKFLKNPWQWPDIWQLNKEQIKNPHRIYPGDIVVLDRTGGKPRLKIATQHQVKPQIYSEELKKEIPSIPASVIEPFISKPLIVEDKGLDLVPRIIAGQDDKALLGEGDIVFVSGIPDASIVDWNIYRSGKPLKDPESEEILGYEAFDLGSVRLVKPGTPAVVKIMTSKEEIARGDRLAPSPKKDVISYVPHVPEKKIHARVMSMYNGMSEGGKYSVITINRGSDDGLALGHVLAINRHVISTGRDENGEKYNTQLPDERYGLVFVFRTFDRISYALVMESSRPVIVGDTLTNP